MNRTLYRVDLEGQYSNREEVVAHVIDSINGLEIEKVYKFKLLYVWVDDDSPGALPALKAVTGITKLQPMGGDAIDLSKEAKPKTNK